MRRADTFGGSTRAAARCHRLPLRSHAVTPGSPHGCAGQSRSSATRHHGDGDMIPPPFAARPRPPMPAEYTLDPADWDAFRALAHQMVDDTLAHLATLHDQPAWRPMPDETRR